MTSPWNTFNAPSQGGHPTADTGFASAYSTQTLPPQAPAPAAPQYAPTQYQAPQYQAPQYQAPQFPPPPNYGFPQGPGQQPPRPNRTALIVSLVVAAVLLIGGGVTAFFLLNKTDAPTPGGSANPTGAVTTSAATGPSISSMGSSTTATATSSSAHGSSTHTTSHGTSSTAPSTGGGDLATAQAMIGAWVEIVNDGDMNTASEMVCEAQRDAFSQSTPPGTLEVRDVSPQGENVAVLLGTTGATSADETYALTLWPTDTGYFLICDGPLSQADLNW